MVKDDVSPAAHAGQIWKYDPTTQSVELVVLFPVGSPFDGPDNITAGPHGFALACTDGDDDHWLVGMTDEGNTFPFAFNRLSDEEFAGATLARRSHPLRKHPGSARIDIRDLGSLVDAAATVKRAVTRPRLQLRDSGCAITGIMASSV